MSLADELWEKYCADEFIDGGKRFIVDSRIDRENFLAALREYGEAVRRRDVEVCKNMNVTLTNVPEYATAYLHRGTQETLRGLAAAIKDEPLP